MRDFFHSIKFRLFMGYFSFILIFLILLPIIYSSNKSSQNELAVIANQSGQQRLVSEMSFLVNKYAVSGRGEFVDDLHKSMEEFDKTFQAVEKPPQDMRDQWQSYREVLTKSVDKIKAVRQGEDVSLEEIHQLRDELNGMAARLNSSINFLVKDMEKASLRRAQRTFNITAVLLFYSIFLGVILTYLISRTTIRPLVKISQELDAVSKGDLTRKIDIQTKLLGFTFKDEIAMMVDSVNRIIKNLRNSIEGIHRTSQEVSSVSQLIKKISEGIKESAETQFRAVEETASFLEKTDASIKVVADDTEDLMKATESASTSSVEMSAAIGEVAENVQRLSVSVDTTASSIHEIAAAIRQVAAHVDTLFSTTEEVASSATEINSVIMEVGNRSREQAYLAEQVKKDASTLGVEAMNKTRTSMEKIKEDALITGAVINRLGERSHEIVKVISVIDDIADTTNLLALNAAILAAQAGEHGRGFAVVSTEVKNLAEGTAAKTKEVSELINQVKKEVGAAINSIERTTARVTEGVTLSREAADALTKIVESSEVSLGMARNIEKATEEQSRGVGQVTAAIQRINNMVAEIKRAADEQKRGSEEILRATEDMNAIAQNVKHSIQEQSEEGKHISRVVSEVAQKVQAIENAIKEQKKASELIVSTIETIRKKADENLALAVSLDKTVKNLDKQSISLNEKVRIFKV